MISQFTTIRFIADTIESEILEFPQTFDLQCKYIMPQGETIIRQFNKNECITAIKVFSILYQGQRLGTRQFKTMESFIAYVQQGCNSPKVCGISYNNCAISFNGCALKYIR